MRRMIVDSSYTVKQAPDAPPMIMASVKTDAFGLSVFERVEAVASFLVGSSHVLRDTDSLVWIDVITSQNCYSRLIEHKTGLPIAHTLTLPAKMFTYSTMIRVLDTLMPWETFAEKIVRLHKENPVRN